MTSFVSLLSLGLAFSTLAPGCAASELSSRAGVWPNGPFSTSGRWIVDANGANVSFAGANWPAHEETMVPDGLQYQSIENVVTKLKSIGLNAVRLTYAIEMVDQIFDNAGKDIPIKTAFVNALGQENGTTVFNKVIEKNPAFNEDTTRLQVKSTPHPQLPSQISS